MKNKVLLWSTIYETHYIKNKVLLWSTSVEKEIVALPFLFFLFFWGLSFFLDLSFFLGLFLAFLFFLLLFGQCSNNDDHHTFITTHELQLETRTRYDSIWMPPAVYRDGAMNQEWHVWKIMHGGFCHKYDVNYKTMQWQYDKSNACHDDDGGSCMAIYLGMAMEMPW